MRFVSRFRSGAKAALLALMMAAFPAFGLSVYADSFSSSAEILVIHSYHPSFDWTALIHEGIIAALDEWGGSVKLSVEYMDTKRINTAEHIEGLVTLYRAKYRESSPDVIICSDNSAYKMLYENRDWMFGPEIPLVFCGVNFFDPEFWPDLENAVGVDERPNLEAAVSLIDSLHPDTPRIVFVNDQSPTGLEYRRGYEEMVGKRVDAGRFLLLDDGTPEDILEDVSVLPKGTVLHYSSYVVSPDGTMHEPTALLERLVEAESFPIYGNYTFMLGKGIVGGPVIDGRLQGYEAANLALGILEGRVDPEQLLLLPSPYSYEFDNKRLKAARIRSSRLPEGSVIHGRPGVFWEEYPAETGLAFALLVLLLAGLVVTFRLLNQRAVLLKGIRSLNTELEERVRLRSEALKRAESILIRNEKLATLGSLVAGIAHEVNSPLGTAVTAASYLKEQFGGFLESAREEDKTPSEAAAEAMTMAESGQELAEMIENNIKKAAAQVSAFRQVAVDQTGETPRRFAMSALIGEFRLSMKNELKKARVGMNIECSNTIVITHFPGDIWRILANLLMNSLKHAYPHGDGGTVSIRVRLAGDSMEILYSDDGIGVPAKLSEHIFDPFYTTARDSGSIGLGLHLVRSIIVDRHGGSIEIDTAIESGVSYRILLPVDSPAMQGGAAGGGDTRA